jgi:predicted nucleic acid-binding protein
MIILDTNVLSALMLETPDTTVIAWLDNQPRVSIWTNSVTVFEIRFGLASMPVGKRRSSLSHSFEQLLDKIGARIAPFDVAAAQHAADLMSARRRKGRPVELRDTMIAGIVLAQNAALATRNTAHFEDLAVRVINPWRV